VVVRTARVGVRVTAAQRRRCFGLLAGAGDVWAAVLDMNRWRRQRGVGPVVSYPALCRELAAAGPRAFEELDSVGARSVLRRYSDAWFIAAKRRAGGAEGVRFPRRKRRLLPVRYYHGTFTLSGRRLRLPVARGCPPLWVRLDRQVPYPGAQVRSVTLVNEGPRLLVEVTAEVPVAVYPPGHGPDPGRVAGVDLGVIHPYALAGPEGQGLLVSGRAIRAEHYMHLRDAKHRRRAVARRAPKPGQAGSRRWRKFRARQRQIEARHRRRIAQAQHEAARAVIGWAVTRRVGTLRVGDPRGVLAVNAGRRHNQRVRNWRPGELIRHLTDKALQAGIKVELVDERGTSSTCPLCHQRVPKPAGRVFTCRHCGYRGHRDLTGAANIACRAPAGGPATTTTSSNDELPVVITHRRAGRHLPGAGRSRRDPRRRPHHGTRQRSPGRPRPAPPSSGESLAHPARISQHRPTGATLPDAALR
jgi:transposase